MTKELYRREMCKYCKFKDNCKGEDIIERQNSLKCNNYKLKELEKKEYIEYVKYMYYDEVGKINVIIKDFTPTDIIHKLQLVYDSVTYR